MIAPNRQAAGPPSAAPSPPLSSPQTPGSPLLTPGSRLSFPRPMLPAPPSALPRLAAYFCVATGLWLMLWAAINSGPWVFRSPPETGREWIHYVRTTFPLAVLVLAPLAAVLSAVAAQHPSHTLTVSTGPAGQRRMVRSRAHGLPGPVRLWLVYGLVATLSMCAVAGSARPVLGRLLRGGVAAPGRVSPGRRAT